MDSIKRVVDSINRIVEANDHDVVAIDYDAVAIDHEADAIKHRHLNTDHEKHATAIVSIIADCGNVITILAEKG